MKTPEQELAMTARMLILARMAVGFLFICLIAAIGLLIHFQTNNTIAAHSHAMNETVAQAPITQTK